MSHTDTNSNHPLAGKVALVTGASRGIGAAVAKRLARDGAQVAITYFSSPDKARAVVNEIEAAGGRALAIKADSGNMQGVKAAVQKTFDTFGRIDVLVNNAGAAALGDISEVSLDDFERLLAVNVKGVFVATQEALRHMGRGGRIINIGSTVVDHVAFPTASVYTLTKGAVTAFARGLVRDLGPRGITVNTVHPGPTDTDMNPADGPVAASVRPSIAVQRMGVGEDVASAVAYLASPEASFVTGANLLVDGGFTA